MSNKLHLTRQFRSRLQTKDLENEELTEYSKMIKFIFIAKNFVLPGAIVIIISNYLDLINNVPYWLLVISVCEIVFYAYLSWVYWSLSKRDPLECSLRVSTPFHTREERSVLFNRILVHLQSDAGDPVRWITGWFFGVELGDMSEDDVRDFLSWSMFEGRNQEHLTLDEIAQLNEFYVDVCHLFGQFLGVDSFCFGEMIEYDSDGVTSSVQNSTNSQREMEQEDSHHWSTFQRFYKYYFEHSQLNTLYFNSKDTFNRLIDENFHEKHIQTANFINNQMQSLNHQLKSYQSLLDKARQNYHLNSKHLADTMHKITSIYHTLHDLEVSASNTFMSYYQKLPTLGEVQNIILRKRQPGLRYAKYSGDPLVGVRFYPFIIFVLLNILTGLVLRVMMWGQGFRRYRVGQITYYYHPGGGDFGDGVKKDNSSTIPIVFIHGIGIGLLPYWGMIRKLMELKRTLILPEIPYVSAFRALQSVDNILSPHTVASNLTAILASHGFMKASFLGHSYGSSWLSFIVKHAKNRIHSMVFLDPICFCLHLHNLTKMFVYTRAHPGTVSYVIRTDMIVRWAIQRGFPWQQISLFLEELPERCSIFCCENDCTIPKEDVENYLRDKRVKVMDSRDFDLQSVEKESLTATIFHEMPHGDFIYRSHMVDMVVQTLKTIDEKECCVAEKKFR